MKYLIVFALIAAASADVSHLKQYLPPLAPGQQAPQPIPQQLDAGLPTKQYLPPIQSAPIQQHQTYQPQPIQRQQTYQPQPIQQQAPIQQHYHQQPAAAASFNQQDGYNYRNPTF